MATAEELLARGIEPNEVSDRPNLLVIDNDLRTISIQPESRVIGVESDEDVNRLYFSMPRMYDDTDLSLFNAYINYMNANAYGDVYIVTDLQPTEDEITFSWLVGRHATEYKGEVKFVVCLKRSENGEIVQEFNTTVHKLTVLEGLEIELTEEEEGKVRDVLAQLLSLIEAQKDEAIEVIGTEGAIQLAAISTSGAAQVQDINDTGKEQKDAVEAAGASRINAIEQKGAATLATIPEDYTAVSNLANQLKDTKADAIMDTSARAASHELHAQDGKLHVTLYGKTTETGTGDKSPDNPYVIRGVDTARVHVGGKNLIPPETISFSGNWNIYIAKDEGLLLSAGTYCFSYKGAANAAGLYVKDPATGAALFQKYSTKELVFTLQSPSRVYFDAYGEPLDKMTVDAVMLNAGDTALPYEPYTANTYNLTFLPDGAPLHGNDTVMDTVANDVASGCDCEVTLANDGDRKIESGLTMNDYQIVYVTIPGIVKEGKVFSSRYIARRVYGNNISGIWPHADNALSLSVAKADLLNYGYDGTGATAVAAVKAYLAANPLTVYYRSTAYTPDKDLRACKTVRRWKTVTLTGDENILIQSVSANGLVNVQLSYSANGWPYQKLSPVAETTHFETDNTLISNATREGIVTSAKDVTFIRIRADRLSAQTVDGVKAYFAAENAAGKPIVLKYQIDTPETYMTDAVEARKPDTLTTDTVTVTGSGETEVQYPHDTKHYTDSQHDSLARAVEQNSEAVNSLSEDIAKLPDQVAKDVIDNLTKIDVEGDFIQIEPKEGTKLHVVSTFSEHAVPPENGTWIERNIYLTHATSKNLFDGVNALGGAGTTVTKNGVTVTLNADGTFLIDGTWNAETDGYVINTVNNTYPYTHWPFPPGMYTTDPRVRFSAKKVHGGISYGNKWGGTVTLDGQFVLERFGIYARPGDVFNNEIRSLAFVRGTSLPDDDHRFVGNLYNALMPSAKKMDAGSIDWNTGEIFDVNGNFVAKSELVIPEIIAMDGVNTLFTGDGILHVTGEKAGLSASNTSSEEAFDPYAWGLPVLKLNGDAGAMSKDTSVDLQYVYGDLSGTCSVKWQGSSSLAYLKKNYTIKFDNAFEAKEGWGEQKKYCLKANYIDHSHARNLVNAKLWGQIVKSRSAVPAMFANLINAGAVDGFPVLLMMNDKFKGLYTFNIPKDAWLMGMGSGTNECILCGGNACPANGFKEEAQLTTDLEIEYITDEENTAWAKTSINNLIRACINSDGSDLDTTIAGMLDWQSAIDYYIFAVLIAGFDIQQKNMLLVTFDGTKWYLSAYDLDCTHGLSAYGEQWFPANYNPTFDGFAANHRLMELVKTYKADAVKARYAELRETVLSESNVATLFANFAGQIPKPVYMQEAKTWTMIPNTSTNDISQIRDYYRMRVALADKWIDQL